MFDILIWKTDRMVLNDLVFRLEWKSDDNWELGDECFRFHKPLRMMKQYAAFWRSRADFRPKRILELGIFDGGSLAFWFELFRPEKLVGLDIQKRGDSPYFQRYAADPTRAGKVKTFWKTDQTDRRRLREIVAQEFGGTLDLVIDDASHMYKQTKSSFETLFPLVRPGGLYIIEDWSWGCWSNLEYGFLPVGTELPALIFQLVEATGSMDKYMVGEGPSQFIRPLIANIAIYADFVVLERGPAIIPPTMDLRLEDCISRSLQLAQNLKYPPTPT
jgi:hypothetical protein